MIPVKAIADVYHSSTEGWAVSMNEGEEREFDMEKAHALIATGKVKFNRVQDMDVLDPEEAAEDPGDITVVGEPDAIVQPTFEIPEDDDDLSEFDEEDAAEDQNDEKDDLPCTDEADAEVDDDEDTDFEVIVNAVRAIVAKADQADLKKDGTPKAFAVNREVGYIVDPETREKAFAEVIKELDRA